MIRNRLNPVLFIFFVIPIYGQQADPEINTVCLDCHSVIYRQWEQSMHAKSNAQSDILYARMMEWAMKDTGGKIEQTCRNCHTPYASLVSDSAVDSTHFERPVDCVYCHSLEHPQKPPVFSSTLFAANENGNSDYHSVAGRAHFETAEICLICHAVLKNPKGIEICTTGPEFERSPLEIRNCQECHMPLEKGMLSEVSERETMIQKHTFSGPYDPSFLFQSVRLGADIRNKRLFITMDNSKTPHGFPTGSPMRMAFLQITAFDQKGDVLFRNWSSNPMKEDPGSVLVRMFHDENQAFPVPPWRAAGVKLDSRLMPAEIRELSYELPEETFRVQCRLLFRLAPVTILDRLAIDDPYLRKAHLIDEIEVAINRDQR